jgi:CheY-like chemotaxis protein
MPVMSGEEFVRVVRSYSRLASIPILALTAWDTPHHERRSAIRAIAATSPALSIGLERNSSNPCRAFGSTSAALTAITGMTLKRLYERTIAIRETAIGIRPSRSCAETTRPPLGTRRSFAAATVTRGDTLAYSDDNMAASAASVLLIEDDPAHQDLMRTVIEEAGFAVRVAANGREGLDLLISLRPEPIVVVLDLRMPVMDGWQLIAIVRSYSRLSVIPVIAVSVADVPPNARHLFELFLSKPIDIAGLVRAITRIAERRA